MGFFSLHSRQLRAAVVDWEDSYNEYLALSV